MLTSRFSLRRAARSLARDGFTLVELLVVIGIIAILAGVALGPITNGIKKAKQSSGVQTAHAIGLAMYSYSNDNSQMYPDFASGDASNVARSLLAGSYVSDPGIFYLADGNGATKYTSAALPAITIAQANVSWDFMSAAGSGVSSTAYTYLPLLWTTLAAGTPPTTFTASNAITATTNSNSPFQTDGMVIFYINNAAAFVTGVPTTATASTVTMVTSSNNTSGAGTGYTASVLVGK